MKSYYAKGRANSDRAQTVALAINNCGYYRELFRELHITRATGRSDYHILFCAKGEIAVCGERLGVGGAYLFLPQEPQDYRYRPTPDARYYWVHFTGSEVAALLGGLGVSRGAHSLCARADDAEAIFEMMMRAVGEGTGEGDAFAASLLPPLLHLMTGGGAPQPFRRARQALEDPHATASVAALAAEYGMSTAHFIRSFVAYTGETPYRYRQRKRMELARMLLRDTTLSVAQIAEEAGFADPQYFCRIFKKSTGYSPGAYRRARRAGDA